MNTANNQLRQNTDKRLREALLFFMEQGKEPGVGDLCERAQINRSTFYRHYLDVFDLMEKTEHEIQRELVQAMKAGGLRPGLVKLNSDALVPMIETVGKYRHFYRSYLRTHLDASMEEGMEALWGRSIMPLFLQTGVRDETHMLYYFQYFKAGVSNMLRLWLDRDCREAPEELARMIVNVLNKR